MNASYQIFLDIPLPSRSLIGLQEKLSFVGEREVARTVNGRAVVLQPAYGSLYAVELSNSGPHVWLPDTFEIGQQLNFVSSVWQSVQLGPGQNEIVLARDAVEIAARDTLSPSDVVPITRNGERAYTVPSRFSLTTVLYRMRLDVVVADFQSTGSATGREQSWTLKLEELGG